MSEKLYTAEVTATGGRDGAVKSSDGILDFLVQKPKSMGGHGGATNPEQLFAAAWASCFLGAMGAVGEKDNTDLQGAEVTVHISFNSEGSSAFLSAEIQVAVPALSNEETQILIDKAHKVCPYSKATKGNIEVIVKAI